MTGMAARLARYAPLLGLVFVALFIGAFAAGGSTPDSDASAAKAVAFFHDHRGAQNASTFLALYGVIFALAFGAVLRSYLRSRASSEGLLAFGYGGIIVFVGGVAVLAGASLAAADVPTKISPAAEQALNVLQNDTFVGMLVGICAFMWGFGLLIITSGALPRWLGWVALVIGVVAVTPVGFFGLLAMLAWTIVTSIVLFLRQNRPAPAGAPGMAG
jgi:hypothetical protein